MQPWLLHLPFGNPLPPTTADVICVCSLAVCHIRGFEQRRVPERVQGLPSGMNALEELILGARLYVCLAHLPQEVVFPLVNYLRESAEDIFVTSKFVASILAISTIIAFVVFPAVVNQKVLFSKTP